MEAVLSGWTLMAKFKEFCSAKDLAPFSKDLWTQIGRFAHLVRRLPDSHGRLQHACARLPRGRAGAAAVCCPVPRRRRRGRLSPT
jgi:hypothetical protein